MCPALLLDPRGRRKGCGAFWQRLRVADQGVRAGWLGGSLQCGLLGPQTRPRPRVEGGRSGNSRPNCRVSLSSSREHGAGNSWDSRPVGSLPSVTAEQSRARERGRQGCLLSVFLPRGWKAGAREKGRKGGPKALSPCEERPCLGVLEKVALGGLSLGSEMGSLGRGRDFPGAVFPVGGPEREPEPWLSAGCVGRGPGVCRVFPFVLRGTWGRPPRRDPGPTQWGYSVPSRPLHRPCLFSPPCSLRSERTRSPVSPFPILPPRKPAFALSVSQCVSLTVVPSGPPQK